METKIIEVCNISKKTICIAWIPSFAPNERKIVLENLWKRILKNHNFKRIIPKKKEEKKDVEK